MYRLNYCQPGALPPFRAFALTAREGLVALPRVSLPSVAGPGLQALPPAEVEGWPSAILNAAYGAYTMETICGTTHCDCLPDSNNIFMHDNQNNKNNLLRCMSCFGCRPITAARRAILQKKLPRYLQNGAFLLYICKKQPLTSARGLVP